MKNKNPNQLPVSSDRNFGFTLPELLITILIMAIVLSIAVPNLSPLISRQDLQAKASLLSSTLAYARNEAVARVGNVTLCGTDDEINCNGSNDLSNGWLVFFDKNADGAFSTNDGDELLKQRGSEGNEVTLTLASSATYISFSDRGESREVRHVLLCTADANANPAKAKTLTVSLIGSTRFNTGGECL